MNGPDLPPEGAASAEELDELERLGKRLGELGLPRHVDRVRTYYAARRAGRPPPPECWAPELTRQWLENLRMPPYEAALLIQPWGYGCPCTDLPSHFTQGVFPGGHRARCAKCGAEWVVLDRT